VASLYTTLSPSEPGACLQLQVQRYYHGYWHAVSTSACEHPNNAGALLVRLPLTGQSGAVFRVRMMFQHTAADQLNSTSWGAWENLRVS
jgi:hypothetical protein